MIDYPLLLCLTLLAVGFVVAVYVVITGDKRES